MPVLAITSLAKSYRAGVPGCEGSVSVLRDVHLAVWPREIVVISGMPGCGTSTLLRCASGLLRPDAGSVCWFGGRRALRDRVAYVCADTTIRAQPFASRGADQGTLYERLARARASEARLLLVDDLSRVNELERRLALAMLRDFVLEGGSVILSASESGAGEALDGESLVARLMTLANGVLTQRRNRSATRIAASSFVSRARSSARSTYGRSLRSPQ